jgi:hypothetical protein
MSRDAFPHDSHDGRETPDIPPHRTAHVQRSTPEEAVNRRPGAPQTLDLGDGRRREHLQDSDQRADSRRSYYVRDRAYLLRDSEIHSLKEIGKFRVISVSDLAKFAYDGNHERMNSDIRHLARQSLITDQTVEIPRKETLRIVTVTKTGHRLLRNTNQLPAGQPIYYGLAKPREVRHDADLYRLYQKEVEAIERRGGRPLRVFLDYELKRNLNRDLARLGPEKDNPDRKSEVAENHHLVLVNGKIPVPDLRVEYETAELELRHVDLELATRDYRPRAMAEKVSAGFSLYGRSEDTSRLRRVLDRRKITARILTL